MFNWIAYTLLMSFALMLNFVICFITGFLTKDYRIRIIVLVLCISLSVVLSILLTANGGTFK